MDTNTSTFRALSKKTLEIDHLTVETLFNRGSVLSSTQSYIPTLSNIGAFSQWINQPISTVYYDFFYGYSTPSVLLYPISTLNQNGNTVSSILQSNIYLISSLKQDNLSTLIVTSNIYGSTVSSIFSSIYKDNTIQLQRYSSINTTLIKDAPGIFKMSTIFYTREFSPYASTLINIGTYYYLQRPSPLPIPTPWYLKNKPVRYIGPGLSSMYDNSLISDSNTLIQTTYPAVLSNTSTGWTASNSSINIYRQIINSNVRFANRYVDNGSSISTVFYNSNISFIALLSTTPNYLNDVTNFSTYISLYFTNYIIPNNGPFISTGNSTIQFMNSTLNSTLLASISSGVLSTPLYIFSNIASNTFRDTSTIIYTINNVPGLCSFVLNYSTIYKPLIDPLSVSTNLYGYQNISSSVYNIFSTFSTNLTNIIGSNLFYNLNTLNSNISSLSTSINVDYSTLLGINQTYITGPGVSTLYSNLSTNIDILNKNYNDNISSILLSFSSFLKCVNVVPGLSSLFIVGSTTCYNINTQINVISPYVNTTYNNDYNKLINILSSVSSSINSNITLFINNGAVPYSTNIFNYINISSGFNTVETDIDSLITNPTGQIWQSLYITNTVLNDTSTLINSLLYSTSYFTMLSIIPDYSTSRDVYPGTILRSTTFYTVETSTLTGYVGISTFMTSAMTVQSSNNSQFTLDVHGGTRIVPDIGHTTYPSLELPNIYMYATDTSVVNTTNNTISARLSSIIFNEGDLTIKRRYNSLLRGIVGINTLNPSYALDIATGDARKLSGSMWLNPSDIRVKENIQTIDPIQLIREISSLRLVSYTWNDDYRTTHGVSNSSTLGFISQEVECIFPSSINITSENGFNDFRSLDVDQLLKSKFGVKQNLIHRMSTLQSRINTLYIKRN